MRVYGASPLYNYVELVFRSKRMFILSIIVSTVIVSFLATTRAKTYKATAVVLLSGTPQEGLQAPDTNQLGSIRYKLNVLNVVLKDPNFIKDAMRDGHLDKDKAGNPISEVEFDRICKDARASITPIAGENVLELNCTWPTDRAADVVNAFYDAYSRTVLDRETFISSNNTKLLTKMVNETASEKAELQKKVTSLRIRHIDTPMIDPTAVAGNYLAEKRIVEELNLQLATLRGKRDEVNRQLGSVPAYIKSITVKGQKADDDLELKSTVTQRDSAKSHLDELKQRYADKHPQVLAAQGAYEALASKAKQLQDLRKNRPVENLHEETSRNPEYDRLTAQRNDLDTQIQGLTRNVQNEQQNVAKEYEHARTTPQSLIILEDATEAVQRISNTHSQLASKLQNAKLEEERDRELHTAEMTLMVKPESEQELSGIRNFLMIAAGPLLGIIIAFAFSLVVESLDHSLRTPIDVEKHLNKPVLAVLPRMDPPKNRRRQLERAQKLNQPQLPS